jgi:hypothetical protein
MKIPIEINKVDDRRNTLTNGFFRGKYEDMEFDVRIEELGSHVFFTATNKITGKVIEEQFDMAHLVKQWVIIKRAEFDSHK